MSTSKNKRGFLSRIFDRSTVKDDMCRAKYAMTASESKDMIRLFTLLKDVYDRAYFITRTNRAPGAVPDGWEFNRKIGRAHDDEIVAINFGEKPIAEIYFDRDFRVARVSYGPDVVDMGFERHEKLLNMVLVVSQKVEAVMIADARKDHAEIDTAIDNLEI